MQIPVQAALADSALMRAERREILRDTVLSWITPLPAARCISGCAARSAADGRVLVAAGNRRFDLLDEGPHAGFARRVAGGALDGLTDALLR